MGLDATLAENEFREDNIGWLELDNGYVFFTDEEAFQKTINLFGIKITEEVK